MAQKKVLKSSEWLLFFYSVPSKPVSFRVKIWRKLIKTGALPFKGSVYILPCNEEHYECFQWLVSEVASMGGEGAFVKASSIETLKDTDMINLFNEQREKDYRSIEKGIEETERKIDSIKKGGALQNNKRLLEEFNRHSKDFEEIRRIDFFSSRTGNALKRRLNTIGAGIKNISGAGMKKQTAVVIPRRIEDFQGKVWVTRKNPFVDRMASAWLIKKFIAKEAVFKFINKHGIEDLDSNTIAFDVRGGEFTHIGDMCTIEVIIKTFGFKDKAIKRIAEIVHEIDLKDEKYHNPEENGIEEILTGIRKTAKSDADALEKGMAVFEMLYASKT